MKSNSFGMVKGIITAIMCIILNWLFMILVGVILGLLTFLAALP